MQTLITDLLTYSRVGRAGLTFQPTDVESILSRTLADLEVVIQENGAVVKSDSLPTVMANPSQMRQLLQNLISNAIKYRSEEPPHIHISAEQKGEEWVFSVQDNGIGIDPEYATRIFRIFQRLHTREEYPGTGIGLAVCTKIVESHGGSIGVESEIGKGSTFYFTIPVMKC
jgi:light-regulated signal transduction histidine kinase (bacteriophytochrome)